MDRLHAFDLLTLVGLRLSAATERGCSALGITPSEARVIVCVATHGPIRPGAAGAMLDISPRRMTQVADSAERKGHVARLVDPTDARARILRLTPSGARLARDIEDLRVAWAEELLADVGEEHIEPLAAALTAILARSPRSEPFGHGP